MQQASLDNTIILILPYSFTTDQHNIQHNENNTEKWTHFKWWEHNVIVDSWFFFQKSFCSHTYEQLKTWWGQGTDCSASLYPNSTHLTECNNVTCMIHLLNKELHQFFVQYFCNLNSRKKTSLAWSQNPQALGYQRLLSLHAAPTLARLADINKLCQVTSAKYMKRQYPHSLTPTDSTNYNYYWDGFFNRPIISHGKYSNLGTQLGAQNEDFGAVSQTDLTRV